MATNKSKIAILLIISGLDILEQLACLAAPAGASVTVRQTTFAAA